MPRDKLLAEAVADANAILAFDPAPASSALLVLASDAVRAALTDPTLLALGADGISAFERELQQMAFEALVAELWPTIVESYARGAGMERASLPNLSAIEDRPAADLAVILDGLRLSGLRETLQGLAWSFASGTHKRARWFAGLLGIAPASTVRWVRA